MIVKDIFRPLITGWPPTWKTWKVREFDVGQGKWKKSGKKCFACGMLL